MQKSEKTATPPSLTTRLANLFASVDPYRNVPSDPPHSVKLDVIILSILAVVIIAYGSIVFFVEGFTVSVTSQILYNQHPSSDAIPVLPVSFLFMRNADESPSGSLTVSWDYSKTDCAKVSSSFGGYGVTGQISFPPSDRYLYSGTFPICRPSDAGDTLQYNAGYVNGQDPTIVATNLTLLKLSIGGADFNAWCNAVAVVNFGVAVVQAATYTTSTLPASQYYFAKPSFGPMSLVPQGAPAPTFAAGMCEVGFVLSPFLTEDLYAHPNWTASVAKVGGTATVVLAASRVLQALIEQIMMKMGNRCRCCCRCCRPHEKDPSELKSLAINTASLREDGTFDFDVEYVAS